MKYLFVIFIALAFVAGLAYGLHETLHYHYGSFQEICKTADPEYWNPAESWRNKYENRDPNKGADFFGSKTFLVWTTDAKHILGSINRLALIFAAMAAGYAVANSGRTKLLTIPATYTLIFLAYSCGFHLVYTLIF